MSSSDSPNEVIILASLPMHIGALLVLIFTSCSPKMIQSESWYVFTESQTQEVLVPASHWELDAPYWTPTEEEVRAMTSQLPRYIRSKLYKAGSWDILRNLEGYRVQVFGGTREGKRTILLNAACATYFKYLTDSGLETENWKVTPIDVLDGGACYFHVFYDMDSRRFSNLWISGHA